MHIKIDFPKIFARKRNVFIAGIVVGLLLSWAYFAIEQAKCENLYFVKECVGIYVPRFAPITPEI